MTAYFPAVTRVTPGYVDPSFIVEVFQASGFPIVLSGNAPKVRLGSEDLVVYKKKLGFKTRSQSGQSRGNLLPSADIVAEQYSCPAYKQRVRNDFRSADSGMASVWGVSLMQALDVLGQLSINQAMRSGCLFGFNPMNAEGLTNSPLATRVTVPADSMGNTDAQNYIAGELAVVFLEYMQDLANRTYQTGVKDLTFKILSPQRMFGYFGMTGIVSLGSFQKDGAGVATIPGMMLDILARNGYKFELAYDDLLIGKGANGTDLMILTIDTVVQPTKGAWNTNLSSNIMPSDGDVNVMYCDMGAPKIEESPIPEGLTQIQELNCTPGWNLRPEALTLISMPFSK